jgi:hypothetical protein
MTDLIAAVMWILGAAGAYSFVMWRKSGEDPDFKKMLPTFIIALIVAGLAWMANAPFDMTLVSLQQTGGWTIILIVADQLARLILNRSKGTVVPPPPTG